MFAAASLVKFRCADDDYRIIIARWFSVDQTLGAGCLFSADHADGVQFADFFGLCHQRRHWAERLAAKIHIQPGGDDADAAIGKSLSNRDDLIIEKLGFVNSDYGGIGVQVNQNLGGVFDGQGVKICPGVRGHFFLGVAVINGRLKNLNFLFGDGRPAQTADQLLGFSAEHRAGDDFNGASVVFHSGTSAIG
jgi:hypothetical protein